MQVNRYDEYYECKECLFSYYVCNSCHEKYRSRNKKNAINS